MTHAEAIAMIKDGVPNSGLPVRWLDLGAGSGVFTRALADLLREGSTVYAVDKASQLVRTQSNGAEIIGLQLDFVEEEIPVQLADGILMANALHYVNNKVALINKLKPMLKPGGRFVILEYDTTQANAWVPYPISFLTLVGLMKDLGFSIITKLNERPSVFNKAMMYSVAVV